MSRVASDGGLPGRVRRFLTRGRDHQTRLEAIADRIAVTGTRGKSTTTSWLYEALSAREYDAYAKITGEEPYSLYNGGRHPIERDGPVKLYETEREMRRFVPLDAIVVENQGIHEYTTRLVNADYVDATVVAVTNVRRDHLDTLGRDRLDVARAFARSVPQGALVVSGERNEAVNEYLERELDRRDATLMRVLEPGDGVKTPADELLAVVDGVLHAIGADPLTTEERTAYRDRLDVTWIQLPNGRVYNAANVNDVESTEVIRRTLMHDAGDSFVPLVYFRRDRPGRTASFIEYLNTLAEAGLIDEVHCVGAHRSIVTDSLALPVRWHDEDDEPPGAVLDDVLGPDRPVIGMGNTVPAFMQELQAEIERRDSSPPADEEREAAPAPGPS